MVLHTALAISAGLIGLAFTLSTFERWLARRRPHELAWTTAFALFTLAAAFLAAGAQAGWSGATFRGFYLFGAIVNVPVLALGTLLLLAGRKLALTATIIVFGFCFFSVGVMVSTPMTQLPAGSELAQGSEVFEPLPRVLAAVGSGLGALVVFAGAVRSVIKRRSRHGVLGNSLIAAGTLILGASGMLNSVADAMTAFSVTLVAGITVLFLGFHVAMSKSSHL